MHFPVVVKGDYIFDNAFLNKSHLSSFYILAKKA